MLIKPSPYLVNRGGEEAQGQGWEGKARPMLELTFANSRYNDLLNFPPKSIFDAPLSEGGTASGSAAFIDKLALILVRDRKQLVARTRGKTAAFTPGGKREKGESDVQALVRECKEELTVDLLTETIR